LNEPELCRYGLGYTPLHLATATERADILRLLLVLYSLEKNKINSIDNLLVV